MEVSPAMGNGQSQQEALSSPTERPVEVTAVSMEQLGTVGASELQDGVQDITECVSTIEDVAMERSDGANGDKQQRNGVVQQELQVNSALESTQETEMGTGETVEGQEDVAKKDEGSDEQKEQNGVVPNGYVDLEQRDQEKRAEQELKPVSGLAETTVNSGGVSGQKENAAVEAAVEDAQRSAASTPSPAVHVADVDMVFPDDEVPIELCPFSSDGSIDPPRVQRPAGNTRVAPQVDLSPGTNVATPVTKLEETTPITPASVTADEPTPQTNGNRTAGRRKRRKKLSFSARKMSSAKVKQDQANAPSSPFIDDKLRISVNGHSAENESKVDENGNAPPSPVYPDADASHLYPSNPEGAPWRWEDCDPYFAPLVHSDLDNLVRWRRECANVIAANPSAWRGLSGMKTRGAVLEAMLADASDSTSAHVENSIRRGRSYRDVWEETDFLSRQKRSSVLGENLPKSQAMKMKKKRKSAVDAEGLLLSHRDLVYGYDDDLFQEFRGRLEARVKACQPDPSPPATPPTPPVRRQTKLQSLKASKLDANADVAEQGDIFDEEVLPSLPCRHFHPASLGLWKFRKNQDPDFTVVHPASMRRNITPVRWKEEMKHHYQQQYELQLQQTDELADPSDGDDEGAGGSSNDQHRATLLNSEVTGDLPSFGDNMEEDEISRALSASLAKLIPLSMYNWRVAQLVYERAACSIQCASVLEGESTAARELEDVYLQLCPPDDVNEDTPTLSNDALTRQPRGVQINSIPHDLIAYSVRHDIANNCSLAVAASVEFALGVRVGDVVDVLDRNGCWNYGEVVETYSENGRQVPKFLLLRFSLWAEDTVEWIAVSEGRLLPCGVADGSRPCTVGPTLAHRGRVRYDQNLARELERSFPQRQARQGEATAQILAHQQANAVPRSVNHLKTPQKRKRKRVGKLAIVASTV